MVALSWGMMRSEKLESIINGGWAFCSFVFVAQRRVKDASQE